MRQSNVNFDFATTTMSEIRVTIVGEPSAGSDVAVAEWLVQQLETEAPGMTWTIVDPGFRDAQEAAIAETHDRAVEYAITDAIDRIVQEARASALQASVQSPEAELADLMVSALARYRAASEAGRKMA